MTYEINADDAEEMSMIELIQERVALQAQRQRRQWNGRFLDTLQSRLRQVERAIANKVCAEYLKEKH